jgi:CBS-domain-containing membrane protein
MLTYVKNNFLSFIGLESNTTSHAEKLASVLGGFIGIFMVTLISGYFVDKDSAALLVASMGASAVLVFGVPHGSLSQPWQLIGGHLVSAVIGVTVAKWLPDSLFAGTLVPGPLVPAALAVALAIGAMRYLRCIHPPGGATALAAVVGGPAVHALGYAYVLTPVLLNAGVILVAAILVNYAFPWRRYPAKLGVKPATDTGGPEAGADQISTEISHADLEYALRKMNLYVDVTEEDLSKIYSLARRHSRGPHLSPDQIHRGHFYSNGKFAERWAVFQVVDESGGGSPDKDLVIYKTVAGHQRGASGILTREDFALAVRHEVFRNENSWQRAAGEDDSSGPA